MLSASLAAWIDESLAAKTTDDGRSQTALLRGRVHRLEALIDATTRASK